MARAMNRAQQPTVRRFESESSDVLHTSATQDVATRRVVHNTSVSPPLRSPAFSSCRSVLLGMLLCVSIQMITIATMECILPRLHLPISGNSPAANVQRDFGSLFTGGTVLDSMTSITYTPSLTWAQLPAGIWNVLSMGSGGFTASVHQSTVVLEPLQFGRCWTFVGAAGYITVKFPEPILPSSLLLEHPPFEYYPHSMLMRAPRDFILWGVIDDYNGSLLSSNVNVSTFASRFPGSSHTQSHLVPLLQSQYHIIPQVDGGAVQSFQIPSPAQDVPATFQIVVLEVLNNWGSDKTCIHHVAYHGVPASVLEQKPWQS